MRKHFTKQYKKEVLKQFFEAKTKGQPLTLFCKAKGLKPSTFYAWIKKYGSDINLDNSDDTNFVKVSNPNKAIKQEFNNTVIYHHVKLIV